MERHLLVNLVGTRCCPNGSLPCTWCTFLVFQRKWRRRLGSQRTGPPFQMFYLGRMQRTSLRARNTQVCKTCSCLANLRRMRRRGCSPGRRSLTRLCPADTTRGRQSRAACSRRCTLRTSCSTLSIRRRAPRTVRTSPSRLQIPSRTFGRTRSRT